MYFLKKKSGATRALAKFLADSRPYGKVQSMTADEYLCPVQRLRSDNGGEFTSNTFGNALVSHSIKHEKSAPYSPHQNGTVERGWRTMFSMARCLLVESKLPRKFWTYAVMIAVYIRNRCYHQRTKQTPFYLLTGKKPNVSNMHVFGTVCYPQNVKSKSKLDNRSVKGVFLGYDKESPAYIVYYPDSGKILTHRVVTFTDKHSPVRQGDKIVDNNLRFYVDDSDDDDLVVNSPDENNTDDTPQENDVGEEIIVVDDDGDEVDEIVVPDDVIPERRSTRVRNPPPHLNDYVTEINNTDDNVDTADYFQNHENVTFCFRASSVVVPKTYKQAMASDDAERWKEAMDDEMNSLHQNNTYTLVPPPKDKQIVGGRWVYAVKVEPSGNLRYKARYVAQGFKQVHGCDYFETFAPTPKLSSVRMMMQMAVELDLLVHQLDVKTAYLNAPLDCEIYMTQPVGYEKTGKSGVKLVCKLSRALYGLKQSGRMWNLLLSKFLMEKGFVQSKHDTCLYVYRDDPEMALLLHWVDDIVVAATGKLLAEIKKWLKDRFRMTDLGQICEFLGIHFKQIKGKITMDQTKYLESKLIKYKLNTCKVRTTPCEMTDYNENRENNSETKVDNRIYREMVGSLIYAMTCTRPDISWAVSKLSQKLSNPSEGDFTMLKHVFRYILGTLDYCLSFTKSSNGLQLAAYSDSDWAGSRSDRKSTSGYVFTLNHEGPAISWKSKKQDSVALSTCEAEYMAASAAAQEAIYLARVLNDLCKHTASPVIRLADGVVVNVDNQGAIGLAKNPVSHNKTKHIDIRYHFVRECVLTNKIRLEYVPSEFNLADVMTKPMSKVKLSKFKKILFGVC